MNTRHFQIKVKQPKGNSYVLVDLVFQDNRIGIVSLDYEQPVPKLMFVKIDSSFILVWSATLNELPYHKLQS